MSIETPESLYASVDREGLTKIISNLLTNAIKYSETYIRIRLYSEGERLLLSVCNDGLVIPVEMREEIFKPFIQYKTGTLRSVPGTGIGLHLPVHWPNSMRVRCAWKIRWRTTVSCCHFR